MLTGATAREATNAGAASALSWLCLLFAAPAAQAQALAQALDPQASAAEPDKSWAVPAAEIVAFDFLLSRYNRRFSGLSDYNVTTGSMRRNLRGPWVTDNDPFKVNQFAHPYQGSLYHAAGRSSGLNYWEASALTFAGSAWWEITGEKTPPSRNDQIASGIAGSFLGEPLYRMAHMVLRGRSIVPAAWRETLAALISPSVGLNRLLFGSGAAFDDHDPAYYGRMHIGATHVTRHAFDTSAEFKTNMVQADFLLDYGLPGKPDYTYRRPFDYFTFQALFSSANGVEQLSTRGMLYGTDYAVTDSYRGIWGLYANYDYLAPQIFHISTTSLSLGTTGQWWATKSIAVQGTAQAGMGYTAVSSTTRSLGDDSEYHYGTAARFAVALRVIVGDRASADVSARLVTVGRIGNRIAGRDDIARVDTNFTYRLLGRHAIGANHLWSHRSASYPVAGQRRQTLSTVGVYYTLLSSDGFGAPDWRMGAAH